MFLFIVADVVCNAQFLYCRRLMVVSSSIPPVCLLSPLNPMKMLVQVSSSIRANPDQLFNFSSIVLMIFFRKYRSTWTSKPVNYTTQRIRVVVFQQLTASLTSKFQYVQLSSQLTYYNHLLSISSISMEPQVSNWQLLFFDLETFNQLLLLYQLIRNPCIVKCVREYISYIKGNISN
jgi:hypothetical protein